MCVCDYAIFTSYIALFFDFAAFRGLCSQANVTLYITLCFSILLYITRYFTYKTYAAYAFVRTLITEAVRMWRIYDSQPQRVFHLIFGGKKAPKKQFAFDLFGFHENFGGFSGHWKKDEDLGDLGICLFFARVRGNLRDSFSFYIDGMDLIKPDWS